MATQIVALGGGGFTDTETGTANPLDRYVLGLSATRNPRVCFLGTASHDDPTYLAAFARAFGGLRCRPIVITGADLAERRESRRRLAAADVVYVGAGSLPDLLASWSLHGVADLLLRAGIGGSILCGTAAGASCWFEGGISESLGAEPAPIGSGLGLVPGTFCAYADDAAWFASYRAMVDTGSLAPGWAATAGAALHFIDGGFSVAIGERPDAQAWRITAGAAHPVPVVDLA